MKSEAYYASKPESYNEDDLIASLLSLIDSYNL